MEKTIFATLPSRLLTCAVLALLGLGTPLGATDLCHQPKADRPDFCPSDERIARLSQELRENNVFFPRGGARLDQDAMIQITLLARVFGTQAMAGTCLRLVGHSDSVGAASVNADLSARRANSVRDAFLAEMGGDAPPMITAGMGEDAPLRGLPDNHVAQRRVTIWAKRC